MKARLVLSALSFIFFTATATAQTTPDHGSRNPVRHTRNNDRTDYAPSRLHYNNRDRWEAMPGRAFRQALAAIKDETFDQNKVKLARGIALRHHLSTVQIRTIAQCLNFDSSKLSFTKYAYATCIDPENYYRLGKIFAFSSSREELYDYMARV